MLKTADTSKIADWSQNETARLWPKRKNGPREEDGVDGWRPLEETGFLKSLVASLAAFFEQATATVAAVPSEAFEVPPTELPHLADHSVC
ncbi:hypothetical protein TYRP_000292 [Tyrophagus putrescentiae]|nr:hypothetical protein TYRP_000292 [Tyrophagus putrescentiae]